MRTIPGYKLLKCLHKGAATHVYQAMRLADQCLVVIKLSSKKIFSEEKLLNFKREFELVRQINSPYVISYLELKQDISYGIALVMEGNDAVELSSIIPPQGFSEREFLEIAIQIVKGLQAIHATNIIHKDLKPSNILIQLATKSIKIIDFNNATTLRQEISTGVSLLLGTLAYISPEQTGRINRSIDYRSDFYSLGVTFYQLLCGQLPFIANDALGFIYQHLAKRPQSLSYYKSTIPLPLSQIIMCLLEKEAENRYQSCEGILHDLTYCLTNLNNNGIIPEFELGLQDFSDKLTLSQHLYGREREIEILVQTLQRVSLGKCEVLMVAGQPGIGKSMFIQEIRQPLVLQNGFFVSGKFDQLNKNVAYSALTQAFDAFIKHLLDEDKACIDQWKSQVLTALGAQAQLIIKVIPNLALLIGEQPAVTIVDISQARNLFNMLFLEFIKVFANSAHPLVIFLDDLQWADNATLELMTYLLQQPKLSHLLWIGAYRDTEVSGVHPAMQAVLTLEKAAVAIQTLTLAPLTLESLCQWLTDSLSMSVIEVTSLAELIQQKTAGNPFFVKMFLHSLYEQQLLIFSVQTHWRWDIDKIRQHPATENVVMLMVYQIKQLASITQNVLSVASCLGHRFCLNRLQVAMNISKEEVNQAIQPALNSGILIKTEKEVYFVHDRVQEAAYHLLNETEKNQLHFTIGERLQAQLEINDAWLFDVVAQFNHCQSVITNLEKRLQIVHLNLKASQKAKQTTAYAASLDYLRVSKTWIDVETLWEIDYSLAFHWHKELAEVEYLSGHFEIVEALINYMQPHLRSILDKIEIYHLLIRQKILQGQYQKAVIFSCEALQLLGIELPLDKLSQFIKKTAIEIKDRLEKVPISSLLENVPIIIDPEKKAIFKILSGLHSGAYLAGVETLTAAVWLSVKLSLTLGHAPESCQSYGMYGFLLGDQFHEYSLGYEFDELAVKLADKLEAPVQRWRSMQMLSTFIFPWFKPLEVVPSTLASVFEACWACGDVEYAGYSIIHKTTMLICQNVPLAKVRQENFQLQQFAQNTKSQLANDMGQAIQRLLANLTGETRNEMSFTVNGIEEADYEKYCREVNSFFTLCIYHFYKAFIFYHYGHFEKALSFLILAKENLAYIPGHYLKALFNWYDSLIHLALYPQVSITDQQLILQQIEQNQQLMQLWENKCSENFTHKYYLVAAELARINKEYFQAESFYEQAIELAGQHGFIQEQALAAELAAKYWLARDKSLCAQGYLNTAFSSYERWGAKHKLMQLKAHYADLLYTFVPLSLSQLVLQKTTLNSGVLKYLDLSSILKASQTISSEIELSKLLRNIMQIIIENAGAQQGAVLLVEKNETLFIQAEATSEGTISILEKIPLADWVGGAHTVIQYVKRQQQPLLIDNANTHEQFKSDPYIIRSQAKSILCVPILKQTELKAILYVENNLISHAFTSEQVQTVLILAAQMLISLENARYFAEQIAHARQLADQAAHIQLAEQSLQVATHDLKLALQASKAGTWNLWIATQKITWDEVCHHLFGLKPGEFGGTYETFMAFVHPEDHISINQKMKQSIENNSPFDFEYRIIWPDGSQHIISTRGHVYQDSQGRPLKMAGVCFDVTQRKQLEEERFQTLQKIKEKESNRATDAIQHKERLEEITDIMCHELRNTLNGLNGGLTLLSEDIKELKLLRDKTKANSMKFPVVNNLLVHANEKLKITDVCTQKLNEVVNDVLDYSKLENNKLILVEIPFDLATVIKYVLQMFSQAIKQNELKIIIEIPDQPIMLKGAESQLKTVLINLITNAIKFTSEGSIKIKAQEKLLSSSEIELWITVEDTGIGIPIEEQAHLFERFSSASRHTGAKYGGSGLGLAISKQLVEKMGGKIWVESQQGKGSKFNFTIQCKTLTAEEIAEWQLKIKQEKSEENLILEPEGIDESGAKKNILVVEDNIVNQKILTSYLDKAGYTSEVANNGLEAIQKFNEYKFDAILMDIEMPEMDGIEATRKIRELEQPLNYATPIIVLSGYVDKAHKNKALEVGMNDYLTKPYHKEAVYEVLKKYIGTTEEIITTNVSEEPIVPIEIRKRKVSKHQLKREKFNKKAAIRIINNAINTTLGYWHAYGCAFIPEHDQQCVVSLIESVFVDRKIQVNEYAVLEKAVSEAICRQSPWYACFSRIYTIDTKKAEFLAKIIAIHDQGEMSAPRLQA